MSESSESENAGDSVASSEPESFAPANPTDGRVPYDFASRWPDEARAKQHREGMYLGLIAILGFGLLYLTLRYTKIIESPAPIPSMFLVFCSGLLGGTVYSLKWWYHSIARGIWHSDRAPWRFAVPWQGAAVATFVHFLFKSDLIGILNPAAMDKLNNTIAFGFLVGYFSDSAIAKLQEIAYSLFGTSRQPPSGKSR